MKSILRFIQLVYVVYYFSLIDFFRSPPVPRYIQLVLRLFPQSRKTKKLDLPVRLKMALTHLGPIYVKFGQILSTRPDVLPENYIKELSQLQDNVPPFDTNTGIDIIEGDLNKKIDDLYQDFNKNPIASASIAQVYQAFILDAETQKKIKVAVKVVRPHIKDIIEKDLNLLRSISNWLEKFSSDFKRLKLTDVINEFDKYLHDEINLSNEAANASLIGRQFKDSNRMIAPKIYFDYSSSNVLTLEWMDGIPVSDIESLIEHKIDLKKLAILGVEIFFIQVFNNGFFHADMHPGNIFVAKDGRYIALDFGIVGSLTEFDKRYLAINLLAFFNRDYKGVASAHIESGWAPAETSVEELESAIRSVCEPFFNQPLSKISIGLILVKLFETSRRFNIEVQPQLVLLQKTLLNVEGLGRQLDPDLDLWKTCRPFLVKWTKEQIGFKSLINNLKKEAPNWSRILPELPRKIDQALNHDVNKYQELEKHIKQIAKSYRRMNYWLIVLSILFILLLFSFIAVIYFL